MAFALKFLQAQKKQSLWQAGGVEAEHLWLSVKPPSPRRVLLCPLSFPRGWRGTVTWPKKHRKYKAPKPPKKVFQGMLETSLGG